ncbi:MAG: DUF86 domain-containing protein [Methylicorpusculum sp.]|uniref:type VII toxin-antitoxin system HepT family RNase toxin n=1 Tax=Methylicorpusculum sp. TaxID=2713644 RepID=UPI00271C5637|nr:DUF86 domain-containing protein [Methylicorpusculum sp.]MDO8845686.1 DUF86 domain-containing protein [Methylicorpusculum sp.]MDO8938772.1 DUF86 domain-containing protein [Methylicorpusculum sp.]MDP2176988.1 DUF86 domain-containing protein [Methylicorpusculum sp.]MDP2201245.1 DUF86 domain-containing protein [Methylicorpusculum sp.]
MAREVIEQKLDSLHRCLQRIEAKFPADVNTLATDYDLQDIISLNLSRAVQLSVDIGAHLIASLSVPPPGTMGETFDLLAQEQILDKELATKLKKSVGFRNIAVHSYESINWEIVHNIVKYHLSEFSEFAKATMIWLENKNNSFK